MNTQIQFEESSFFQDFSNKDVKLSKNFSNESYSHSLFENKFENQYDINFQFNNFASIAPANKNQIFTAEKKQKEDDDNSSNLADTEEHVQEEIIKKSVDNIEKEFDTNEQSYDSSSIKFNQRDVNELLDMISKPNTDMNAFLSEVLTSGPTDPMVKRKRAISNKVKGKRIRKTKEQLEVLTQEYKNNSDWTSEDINEISSRLNLTNKQVYKWFWDQRISNGETKPRNW